MKIAKILAVIYCSLIFVFANSAMAANGDIYSGGANFSTDKKTKAKDSPALQVGLPIPPEIVQGVEFHVDCVVQTAKDHNGTPRPGAKGSLALFALTHDVATRTWDYFGLLGSGIPFKTQTDGAIQITSGPIIAGSWANNPTPVNDIISASIQFANKKRIRETGLYCEIIVGQ